MRFIAIGLALLTWFALGGQPVSAQGVQIGAGTNVQAGVQPGAGVGVSVPQAGVQAGAVADASGGEPWRYRWHDNRWWYWNPDNRWSYRTDNGWAYYDPGTYASPTYEATYVQPYSYDYGATPYYGGHYNSYPYRYGVGYGSYGYPHYYSRPGVSIGLGGRGGGVRIGF